MAKNATPEPAAEFVFVGVSPTERPKRTGRGGKVKNPEIGRQMLALILSGQDVTDNVQYEPTDDHTADELARSVAVKATRYLAEALIENPQTTADGKNAVPATRIKNGRWYMFLGNPRERKANEADTPTAA